MKYDVKRREYDVVVIGEEPHLAYNRVGLTSFFQHRLVENLYLNPREWVSSCWWLTDKGSGLTSVVHSTRACPRDR